MIMIMMTAQIEDYPAEMQSTVIVKTMIKSKMSFLGLWGIT